MCYRTEIKVGIEKIAKRFNATVKGGKNLTLGNEINGFDFQATPIIINEQPHTIQSDYYWGFIPEWAKDNAIRKSTLNAKIETLEEKPAYRNVIHNRCLVIATGYYEWHWNDEKGKSKQKYEIHSAENELFAFAGIYSRWINPVNGTETNTYSIITTEANQTMSYIHNIKKRMPVVLKLSDEIGWLHEEYPIAHYSFPNYDAPLVAFPAGL